MLGRCPSHQRALLRNLASALFLTERDADLDDNRPKVKGRIITTLQKAKEVRPLVEKVRDRWARNSMEARTRAAAEFGTTARAQQPGVGVRGGPAIAGASGPRRSRAGGHRSLVAAALR